MWRNCGFAFGIKVLAVSVLYDEVIQKIEMMLNKKLHLEGMIAISFIRILILLIVFYTGTTQY